MTDTRLDEMREQVNEFHHQNQDVWRLFCGFTFDLIELGYKNYSAKAVFERIRWEKDTGGDGVNQFKLNNNYTAFYGRRFMRVYPEHDGFFRTREQISEAKDATHLDELGPQFWSTVYRQGASARAE